MSVDEQALNALKERIIAYCNPEKILLFGSRARGDHRDDSDVDLLVVWGGKPNLPRRQRNFMLRNAIGFVSHGLDIIAYTPEELEAALADPRSFTSAIVKEAKLIHG